MWEKSHRKLGHLQNCPNGRIYASSLVQSLNGEELQLEMDPGSSIAAVTSKVAEAWSLDQNSFMLTVGESRPKGEVLLNALLQSGSDLCMQVVKYDPLLKLGQFDLSDQRGIIVTNAEQSGETSKLRKTSGQPDSNNVFLQHQIDFPCFAEFRIIKTGDEMLVGVAHKVPQVARASGFSNLSLTSTWSYGKAGRRSMPVLFFGGERPSASEDIGFQAGDLVAIFVDIENKQVKFYKNGTLVVENLPEFPFPDDAVQPFQIFVMVDATDDEVEIVRFGPFQPY
jgi:hypothetical protein